MKNYAIKKNDGYWVVGSDDGIMLQFETYDAALETAQRASETLASPEVPPTTIRVFSRLRKMPGR